eukprot:363566-Chlamydomonas_euryale.AAC.6
MMAGYDDNGPQLYQIDPSGTYFAWRVRSQRDIFCVVTEILKGRTSRGGVRPQEDVLCTEGAPRRRTLYRGCPKRTYFVQRVPQEDVLCTEGAPRRRTLYRGCPKRTYFVQRVRPQEDVLCTEGEAPRGRTLYRG